MRLKEWLQHWLHRPASGRQARPDASRRCSRRLVLEPLEDRTVPSNVTAGSVADLIADINAANGAGGSNTITLVAGTIFTLTALDNTTDGATGLPVIAASNNLTIIGNGDTIARSTASSTPAFRLLDVASGGSLTLNNLTLQGGLAFGAGVSAEGGAIYNLGTLLLDAVTVQSNIAQGSAGAFQNPGASAAGGGIYSSGTLTLQGCTIQNNQAVGGQGAFDVVGYAGGDGLGGGLYTAGGTVSLSNVTVHANTAQGGVGGGGILVCFGHRDCEGGYGGPGGNGFGGGLYVASGTVSLTGTTVDYDTAKGGAGGKGVKGHPSGNPGLGVGGGLYIQALASVSLDAFTQANVTQNSASTSDPDIFGSYTTSP
jgi:hypothetical protein